MFADIMSVIATVIATTALVWQIKTEFRSEPVLSVKLTQDYDRRHGVDHLTLTVVNWGRSDVTITDRGVKLFNGRPVEELEWVGRKFISPQRLQAHSSIDWWFWPESASEWCDKNGVSYDDLIPYVVLAANGKTVQGEAQ